MESRGGAKMNKKNNLLTWCIATAFIISATIFISKSHYINHESYNNKDFYGYKYFNQSEKHVSKTSTHSDPEFWGVPDL